MNYGIMQVNYVYCTIFKIQYVLASYFGWEKLFIYCENESMMFIGGSIMANNLDCELDFWTL